MNAVGRKVCTSESAHWNQSTETRHSILSARCMSFVGSSLMSTALNLRPTGDSAEKPGNLCTNCELSNIICSHDMPRQPKVYIYIYFRNKGEIMTSNYRRKPKPSKRKWSCELISTLRGRSH